MRNTLPFILLLFSATLFGQATEPYAGFTGESFSVANTGANTFRITVKSLVSGPGVFNGTDVTANGDFYLIYKSNITGVDIDVYRITNVVSAFANQITVDVLDIDVAGQPPASNNKMIVAQTDMFGRFPWIDGATDNLNQSISAYGMSLSKDKFKAVPNWLTTESYAIGDVIAYGGVLYANISGSNTGTPDVTPADWSAIGTGSADGVLTGATYTSPTMTLTRSVGGDITVNIGEVVSGAGAPATAPADAQKVYFDTTNKLVYFADGGAWVQQDVSNGAYSGHVAAGVAGVGINEIFELNALNSVGYLEGTLVKRKY